MDAATAYFTSISTNGGWCGIYSLDLKERYGESLSEKARPTQIWVQPPGTPTVGQVLLRAYRATGDAKCLAAARGAGRALAWGQSAAGGWNHLADVADLRPDSAAPQRKEGRCTFDDNITQGAIDFLMDLDDELDEPWLDDAVALGLAMLLRSQFPNGAWPQGYPLTGGYHDYYTFNDGAINDCIRVLVDAHRRYRKGEHLAAARRGGEFIILSQGAAPQSGWAQQYSHDMKPAWARAFEPPCFSSASTCRNIRTLADLAVYTGDAGFLAPIPAAVAWLEKSKLRDNVWARMYEPGTNKPIYGDRDKKVHYTLEEISEERRTGYSWQGDYGLPAAVAYYNEVRKAGPAAYAAERARRADVRPSPADLAKRAAGMEPKVKAVIGALDEKGRWASGGRIRSKTFVANLGVLSDYLAAAAPPPPNQKANGKGQ
ncbi:MAG: hypothetical protein FJ288_12175 [Planctomycetes bacterium]|nr:hypothetical protein [Planctomycetota bacterium]